MFYWRKFVQNMPRVHKCDKGALGVKFLCCWIVISYFASFEAGIANAISSFKWRKMFLFITNRRLPIFF